MKNILFVLLFVCTALIGQTKTAVAVIPQGSNQSNSISIPENCIITGIEFPSSFTGKTITIVSEDFGKDIYYKIDANITLPNVRKYDISVKTDALVNLDNKYTKGIRNFSISSSSKEATARIIRIAYEYVSNNIFNKSDRYYTTKGTTLTARTPYSIGFVPNSLIFICEGSSEDYEVEVSWKVDPDTEEVYYFTPWDNSAVLIGINDTVWVKSDSVGIKFHLRGQ